MERSRIAPGPILRKENAPRDSSPRLAIVGAKDVHETSPAHLVAERYGIGARTGIFRGLVLGLPVTIAFWAVILWVLARFVV